MFIFKNPFKKLKQANLVLSAAVMMFSKTLIKIEESTKMLELSVKHSEEHIDTFTKKLNEVSEVKAEAVTAIKRNTSLRDELIKFAQLKLNSKL